MRYVRTRIAIFALLLLTTSVIGRAQLPAQDPISKEAWQVYTKQQLEALFPNEPLVANIEIHICDKKGYAWIEWDPGKHTQLHISRKLIGMVQEPEEYRWVLAHEVAHPKLGLNNRAAVIQRSVTTHRWILPKSVSLGPEVFKEAELVVETRTIKQRDFVAYEKQERSADLFAFWTLHDRGDGRCAGAQLLSRFVLLENIEAEAAKKNPDAEVFLRRLRFLQSLCRYLPLRG